MTPSGGREGQKPVQFWADEDLRARFGAWCELVGSSLTKALVLAMDTMRRVPAEILKEAERLAIIHRVEVGEVLASALERGLALEAGQYAAGGHHLALAETAPEYTTGDGERLTALESKVDRLATDVHEDLVALKEMIEAALPKPRKRGGR